MNFGGFFFLSERKYILIIVKLKRRMKRPSHKVQNLIKLSQTLSTPLQTKNQLSRITLSGIPIKVIVHEAQKEV